MLTLMATLRKGRQIGAFLVLTRMATLRKGRKIGAVGCERARALSRAAVWQPLGKGERLVCFVANAHSGRRAEHEASPNFLSGGCTEPEKSHKKLYTSVCPEKLYGSPLGRGERLVCFDVNAHTVSLVRFDDTALSLSLSLSIAAVPMATFEKGRKIGVL